MLWARATAILAAVVGLLAVGGAVAQAEVERYNDVLRGGIVATGNTLGLSKAFNLNDQGNRDSIGTFIAAGAATQDGPGTIAPYPVGTTSDWTANASDAVLALPAGSEVVRAELIWGGSYQYPGEDVMASLDSNVSLGSGADSTSVAPDPDTASTFSETASTGFQVRYYMRTADVTSFVASHGAGTYRVGGVPATQDSFINTLNAAGWTLAVVYRQASAPDRAVSLTVGGDFIDEDTLQDYAIDGFCAPDSGPVTGKVLASSVEGDANFTGDQLLAGPSTAALTTLSGPNNPADNFFASQINLGSGLLDTSGSFGSVNHDAINGVNVTGGRQSWDVTGVATSAAQLANGQDTLSIRAATVGDNFSPTLIGTEVEVDAPRFAANAATLADSTLAVGETTTLTIPLDNTAGAAAAQDVTLNAPLPAGVGLSSFTIDGVPGDAGGAPVGVADLTTGVDVGTVPAGSTKVVRLVVSANSVGSFALSPSWSYDYAQCAGAMLSDGSASLASAALTVAAAPQTPPGGGASGGGSTTPAGGSSTLPPSMLLDAAAFRSFLPRGTLRADRKGRIALSLKSPVAFATTAALVLADGTRTRGAATFGRGGSTLAARGKVQLRIKLSKAARRTLARRGKLEVRITATVKSSSGPALTVSRTLTVRPPRS